MLISVLWWLFNHKPPRTPQAKDDTTPLTTTHTFQDSDLNHDSKVKGTPLSLNLDLGYDSHFSDTSSITELSPSFSSRSSFTSLYEQVPTNHNYVKDMNPIPTNYQHVSRDQNPVPTTNVSAFQISELLELSKLRLEVGKIRDEQNLAKTIQFNSIQTKIGLLNSTVKYIEKRFVRSASVLAAATDDDILSLAELLSKDLHSSLLKLENQVISVCADIAYAEVTHGRFIQVIDKAKATEKEAYLTETLLHETMKKRCISVHSNRGKYNRDTIPNFSGQGGLTIFDFESHFNHVMGRKYIPVSDRNVYLIEALSGIAKKVVMEEFDDNVWYHSTKELFLLLYRVFGTSHRFTAHLLASHRKIGFIPEKGWKEIHKTAFGHLQIAEEMIRAVEQKGIDFLSSEYLDFFELSVIPSELVKQHFLRLPACRLDRLKQWVSLLDDLQNTAHSLNLKLS